MQKLLAQINKILRLEDKSRSAKARRNIIVSFFSNGFNFLSILLLVPLTLKYLGPVQYGLWLTLSSLLMWLGYMDFGIGNGLRNRLAESLAEDKRELAKNYISTAYATFGSVILIIWLIFFAVFGFVNWGKIFNSPENLTGEMSKLVFWVFIFFSLQFFFKLINSVLNADQKPAINNILNTISNTLVVLCVFILYHTTKSNIFFLGLGSSLIPNLVFLIASIILFSKLYKAFAPSLKAVKLKYSKDLLSLGMQFFVIQIAGFILFATDNMIITQIFGPAEVTTYNIAYKYFFFVPLIFNVILNPFWSAYTEAYVKDDIEWIKRVTKKILRIWMILSIVVIVMILAANFVYKIWVGPEIKIPLLLSVVMGGFAILSNWNNIFAYFINGVGKIKLQFYNAIIVAIINIPLSILFAKYFKMGIAGVMTATLVCVGFGAIWAPIQYKKLINKTATGIWNK